MTLRNGLTNKQQAFIEHYLQCWNATEAARQAGYRGNDNTLASVGSENLRKPNIRRHIQDRLNAAAMTADEVLARLSEQARSDISEYINDFGYLDFDRLKADGKAHLIKKYDITNVGGKLKIKFEVYDAQAALVHLGKAHALFTDKVAIADWRREVQEAGLDPAEVFNDYVRRASEALKSSS